MSQNPKVDQMDVVKAFNNELVSLYEMKPPISKAKMTAITKAAIRALKYYKHVVQGVEKFVSKCKQEFKIPGLYVIDSIVRQSRHQFGPDKDVFAARFAKNLPQTFVNIFQCPQEDKARVVRVVNLWKKSKLFSNQLLSELLRIGQSFDADTDVPLDVDSINKLNSKRQKPQCKERKNDLMEQENVTSSSILGECLDVSSSSTASSRIMSNCDLEFLQRASISDTSNTSNSVHHSNQVRFNKNLLDFDYGEEDDEEAGSNKDTSTNVHHNSNSNSNNTNTNTDLVEVTDDSNDQITSILGDAVLKQLKGFMDQVNSNETSTCTQQDNDNIQQQFAFLQSQQFHNSLAAASSMMINDDDDDDLDDNPQIVMEKRGCDPLEVIDLVQDDTSPSREYTSDGDGHNQWNNNNNNTRRFGGKDRQMKIRSKEEERERRRKALPPIRRKHLSVCSTTLWVGHLSKSVQKQDLLEAFGEFGEIRSIDIIQPRGCAFLCLSRRQDAMRALHRLRHLTLHGKSISLDWAPGKGLKGSEWQPNFDLKNGVCYIPWNKLNNENFDYKLMEEGGVLDADSMPDWLKEKLEGERKKSNNDNIEWNDVNSTIDDDSSPVDMIIDQPSGNQDASCPSNVITTHLVNNDDNININDVNTNAIIKHQSADIVNSMLNPFGLSPQLLAPVNVMPMSMPVSMSMPMSMSVPPPSILLPPPTINNHPLKQQFHPGNMEQIEQQQNGQRLFLNIDKNKGDEDFRIISDGGVQVQVQVQSKEMERERERQERCNNKERRNTSRWQSLDDSNNRDRSSDRDNSININNNNNITDASNINNNYQINDQLFDQNSGNIEGNRDNTVNDTPIPPFWNQPVGPNGDQQQQLNNFHQRIPPPNTHFNSRHFTERPPTFIPSNANQFRPNIHPPYHDTEVAADEGGYSRQPAWRAPFDHARGGNSFHRVCRPPPVQNMFRNRTPRPPPMFRPLAPGVRGRNMNVFNNRCRAPPPLMGQGFRNELREKDVMDVNNISSLVNDDSNIQVNID